MSEVVKPTKDKIVKGKIANALTSAAKNHIVATTDDLYDTNFLEYQDELNKRVDDTLTEYAEDISENTQNIETIQGEVIFIEERIPPEASPENQLADKVYVDTMIKESASYFRGCWENWSSVPTNPEEYPEDIKGNHTPIVGDYIVIEDTTDYYIEPGMYGTWRFSYNGVWEIDGKNGWQKEYRIEDDDAISKETIDDICK